MTRCPTESVDVLMANHLPSALWYVPRGTEYGFRPQPRLLDAEQLPHRRQGAHDLKQRLEQVHVDHLPDAGVHGHHGDAKPPPVR